MTIWDTIDRTYIKNTNWYRQGGAGLPFYFWIPFTTLMDLIGRENIIIQQEGALHHAYFNRNAEFEAACADIQRQRLDGQYIDQCFEAWRERNEERENYYRTINWQSLQDESTEWLLNIYRKLCELDYTMWELGVHIELFDPCGEQIIADELRHYRVKLSAHDVSLLLTPQELSFGQEEHADLLRIALLAPEEQPVAFIRHQAAYFWCKNDWAHVENLSIAYFQNQLERLSDAPKNILCEQLHNLEKRNIDVKKEQQIIIEKYNIPQGLQAIFYLFQRMGYWRDLRKRQAMITNIYYDAIGRECARRSGVSFDDFSMITSAELFQSVLVFSDSFKAELQSRAKRCFYYVGQNKAPIVITGSDYGIFAQTMREVFCAQFTELRGMVACRGKAQGKVKIVNVQADFAKILPGDILVTMMTRPEFVPLMRIAAAIVTDEGGVTSHAAIMSRELHKPCIIGVQIATEVLRDGESVEVDAENGIIRKIS